MALISNSFAATRPGAAPARGEGNQERGSMPGDLGLKNLSRTILRCIKILRIRRASGKSGRSPGNLQASRVRDRRAPGRGTRGKTGREICGHWAVEKPHSAAIYPRPKRQRFSPGAVGV